MYLVPDNLKHFRQTVAEIDLEAFGRNILAVRSRLAEGSRLIAVMKADAYGHGAVPLARVCAHNHVAMIAVALLEEALELHSAAIDLPILILSPLTEEQIALAADLEFSIGIVGPEALSIVCALARSRRRPVRIHLNLDSGMNRLGLLHADMEFAARELSRSPFVQLEAIYTHFANASNPDDPFTKEQIGRFEEMVAELRRLGVHAPLHHLANSAATVQGLAFPGDFVRVGLSLYGGEPLDIGSSRLEPVMSWVTRVARLKHIPPGAGVGYGQTFVAQRQTQIATLPVGYADGYNRLLSNSGEVLIRGRRAPVVGRVSMDLITVDVTDIPGVMVDDEAVMMGAQGDERITAEDIAAKTGTIPYEVLCAVSARVPRIYKGTDPLQLNSKFGSLFERIE